MGTFCLLCCAWIDIQFISRNNRHKQCCKACVRVIENSPLKGKQAVSYSKWMQWSHSAEGEDSEFSPLDGMSNFRPDGHVWKNNGYSSVSSYQITRKEYQQRCLIEREHGPILTTGAFNDSSDLRVASMIHLFDEDPDNHDDWRSN